MRSLKASGFMALGAALAVAGASVPFGGFITGVVGPAPQSAVLAATSADPGSAGQLVLSTTSSQGIVRWDEMEMTQRFSEAQQCRIVQASGAPDLLSLAGTMGNLAGTAGFRNGDIGVYEVDPEGDGASNAAHCSTVDSGSFTSTETLSLMLGEDAVDESGEQLVASKATISIIAKSKSGRIDAMLVDDDGNPLLGGGRTITWGPPSGKNLKNGEPIDVGAPFTIPGKTFSGITLKAASGGFSMRGAVLDVQNEYDGTLDCNTSTFTREASGLDPQVTVTRLDNADDQEDCDLIPYTLRNSDQEVQFLKPLDEQTTAQFILDIVWTVSPANTGATGSPLLPDTYIDYELESDLGEIPLRWCPDVTSDSNDNPIVEDVLNNEAAEDQVPESVLAGKQFTCILSQHSVVSGDPDVVTVEQRLYLLGDARMLMR